MEAGSDLNLDETPVPGSALADGSGLATLGPAVTNLNITGVPNNISDGLAKQGENK